MVYHFSLELNKFMDDCSTKYSNNQTAPKIISCKIVIVICLTVKTLQLQLTDNCFMALG